MSQRSAHRFIGRVIKAEGQPKRPPPEVEEISKKPTVTSSKCTDDDWPEARLEAQDHRECISSVDEAANAQAVGAAET